jgi:hypothetical protein
MRSPTTSDGTAEETSDVPEEKESRHRRRDRPKGSGGAQSGRNTSQGGLCTTRPSAFRLGLPPALFPHGPF